MVVELRRPATKQRTLLIVDDEPDILESMVEYLAATMPHLQVYTAASGEQALVQAKKIDVDVVVSDLRMPGMNGLALLEAVQRTWPKTHCILMTAFNEADLDRRAKEIGVEKVLRKPFEMAGFEAIIAAALT